MPAFALMAILNSHTGGSFSMRWCEIDSYTFVYGLIEHWTLFSSFSLPVFHCFQLLIACFLFRRCLFIPSVSCYCGVCLHVFSFLCSSALVSIRTWKASVISQFQQHSKKHQKYFGARIGLHYRALCMRYFSTKPIGELFLKKRDCSSR